MGVLVVLVIVLEVVEVVVVVVVSVIRNNKYVHKYIEKFFRVFNFGIIHALLFADLC